MLSRARPEGANLSDADPAGALLPAGFGGQEGARAIPGLAARPMSTGHEIGAYSAKLMVNSDGWN